MGAGSFANTQDNSTLGTSSGAPAPTTNNALPTVPSSFFSGLPAYAQGFNPYAQPFMSQFAQQGQQGGWGLPPWMRGQQGGFGGPPPWMQGGYGGWGHHDWNQNQQQPPQTQSPQQANAPANPNSTTFTP